MLRVSLKRCAASGIAFVRTYRADPFLRTEVNVILIQTLFSLIVVASMALSFITFYQSTLTYVVSDIQTQVFANALDQVADPVITQDFNNVYQGDFLIVLSVGVLFMLLFGYLTVRIALEPVKGALAAQKQFIGNIAHELRTPLSIIRMNTELELLDQDVPLKVKTTHESNLEEIVHISEIINNLLTLNTLVMPGTIELDSVSMNDVVDRVMEKLSPLARMKQIAVSVKKSAQSAVWGNLSALEQVATNIIKNAIAYTPEGGEVAISIQPNKAEGAVGLSVRDSGIGIAEKDLFRVFDPFYRADTSRSRRGGGSGLGLAIVSELVRLHHGRITIESKPKRGTTVSVFIPTGKHAAGIRSPSVKKSGEISMDFSKK